MPASTTQPLHFANKLLAEAPLPLQSSQAMLPVSDPLFAKHWVLVQDVGAPDMEDSRCVCVCICRVGRQGVCLYMCVCVGPRAGR